MILRAAQRHDLQVSPGAHIQQHRTHFVAKAVTGVARRAAAVKEIHVMFFPHGGRTIAGCRCMCECSHQCKTGDPGRNPHRDPPGVALK
jgi:hypothetical protein